MEENQEELTKEVEVVETAQDDELQKTKKELEETTDRLKRLMAEFDNFKKRSAKERESLYNSILSDVIISILPVIDNLDKAVLVKTEDLQYKQGVELVQKQLQDTLVTLGVKKIETIGERFDPELHEAVSHVDDENLSEQEIKDEFRAGYKIGNKVIRHSMVVVAN